MKRNAVWIVRLILVLVMALGQPLAQAQTLSQEELDAQAAALEERARTALATLEPLLETRSALEERLTDLAEQIETAEETEKQTLSDEIDAVQVELDGIRNQISVVTTGISEREFRESDAEEFDLQSEVENLIEPFLFLLLGATENARQLERTRRDLASAEARFIDAETAVLNLDATLELEPEESIRDILSERREIWAERVVTQETQIAALNQQIIDLASDRVSPGRQVDSAVQGFVRERSLSLVFGLGAFVLVFLVGRLIASYAHRIQVRRNAPRTFATRLTSILFSVFTLVAGFGAMLVIFNMRNDWLLLGLTAILAIALIWAALKALPSLIDQLSVLLNLGAVQEDERVLFNGVPFKVAKLHFYSDLVNPALDGGEFTLPVRELVGLYSRPAAQNEAWFPSEKGDWVRLSDGNSGQVMVQTPEMVVVELLGGARATYQTADYLAQTPENLSHGYRVEIEFGIGYGHQAEATGSVIQILKNSVKERMVPFVGADHVRDVEVEFLRAGASSIDYEVEVDVTGDVAERFEEIERELARVVVEIATENGWEIPFQQITIHQAS